MLIILIILILILIFLRSPLVKKGISIVNNEDNLENGYKNEPYEYDGGPNGLLRLLNDISSADKVILENITSKHILNKDIIDEELNIQVLDIIKKIINSINGISDYLLYLDSIENMYVMRDDDGNYRSILNCIIYEVKNFYTIRLTMDFVVFEGEVYFNFIDIDESSIHNIMNKYDIRWETIGILTNYDMFDDDVRNILDKHYSEYGIVFLNNKDNTNDKSSTFTLSQLMNRYLPSESSNIDELSPYFCKKDGQYWNSRGVLNRNKGINCIKHDNTYQGVPNTPLEGLNTLLRYNISDRIK